MASRTLYQVLSETAAVYGDLPALHQPDGAGYLTYTWNEYLRAAEEIAAGLNALGIGKGQVVGLDSETRLEFYLADMGTLANGSIAAALYPSYPTRDLVRNLENAGAVAAFVENPEVFRALRAAPVRHWILLTGKAEGAMTLAELRAMGRDAMAADPEWRRRLTERTSPRDPAVLYLTSGATGEPKMALVTHDSIVSNIDMGPALLPLGPEDETIVFLPSAHIAQRVVMEFLMLRCGVPVYFSESLLRLPQEIRSVRPTVLLAPPRMWERIYTSICTELRKRPAALRKAFYGALALALAAARYRNAGKPVPLRLRIPLRLADRAMFRKIRQRFGGRLRLAASGAAPLSKELAEFYDAIGMPLIEGYGLTEGGVLTMNPLGKGRPGSIGKPLSGSVELRISEESELLARSPTLFSGYWNDPATTAEVLRDGWLHTGDLAFIGEDGYVHITGRKKELIVSSTGKKVHPARVEGLFNMEPLVSHVLLIGDRLPYVVALVTLNPATAQTLKGMDHWQGPMAQAPPVQAEMRKVVARVNKQLAPFEQVRKYRILDREFSIDSGELTATMKVRRTQVIQNFEQEIAELYAGRE
ncbi:MAG: AMP-dependent synthetase/ligase [Bryobacteraceae bacterium]